MRRIGIAVWVLLVIALAGLPSGVQAQSDDGLVAEWHFDEGAGSVLVDSSGNGNDGVIYGAKWVDGKFGSALSFDGVDDYAEILRTNIVKPENSVTISAWVKAQSSFTLEYYVTTNGFGLFQYGDQMGLPQREPDKRHKEAQG